MDYTLICKAGQEAIFIMKKNVNHSAYARTYTEIVILEKDSLIKKALAEGEKQERCKDIYFYQLKHAGGITLVYQNKTKDKTIVEDLDLDMKGLEIVDNKGKPNIKVKCPPNQVRDVQIKATGGPWSFGLAMYYYIEG
jgi:hypothetical protein